MSSTAEKRDRALLEQMVGNLRHLLTHLALEEKKYRMCPICRCEYVLEPHDEDCAYEETCLTLATFDKSPRHIDNANDSP